MFFPNILYIYIHIYIDILYTYIYIIYIYNIYILYIYIYNIVHNKYVFLQLKQLKISGPGPLKSAEIGMETCLAPLRAWLRCTRRAEEKVSHALAGLSKASARNPWKFLGQKLNK